MLPTPRFIKICDNKDRISQLYKTKLNAKTKIDEPILDTVYNAEMFYDMGNELY